MPQEFDDTYSHIHHDTITEGKGESENSSDDAVTESLERGQFSMLFSGDKSQKQNVGAYLDCQHTKQDKKKTNKKNRGEVVLHAILGHHALTYRHMRLTHHC